MVTLANNSCTSDKNKQVKITLEPDLVHCLDSFVSNTNYSKSDLCNLLLKDFFYDKDLAVILRHLIRAD